MDACASKLFTWHGRNPVLIDEGTSSPQLKGRGGCGESGKGRSARRVRVRQNIRAFFVGRIEVNLVETEMIESQA